MDILLKPLESSQLVLASSAAALGVCVHTCLFAHGEWHLQAPLLLAVWLLVAICVPVILALMTDRGVLGGLAGGSLLLTSFTSAVFLSMCVYRVALHRLHQFPGPFMAKVTKLYHVYKCLDSRQCFWLDELYHQYGEIVRTGPNELLVVRGDIHELQNTMEKSDWYDLLLPSLAIISVRDKKVHAQRRRLWDGSLNIKTLSEFVPRIMDHVTNLETRLSEAAESKTLVNANEIFSWYAYDTMGDFAFGQSFGMLENSRWHYAPARLQRGMSMLGPTSCVPWMGFIGFKFFPNMEKVQDFNGIRIFSAAKMKERIAKGSDRPDIATRLIEAAEQKGFTPVERKWLEGDGMTLVIAGSGTTQAALVFLFYHLALDRSLSEQLYEELQDVDVQDFEVLRRLPLLNAIINESLRLHPVLPSAVYRNTPPEGMMIGETFIPGDVKIIAPRYSISRLESCYERATEFVPERWSTRPEMIKDKRAFSPFGTGRFGCAGKGLAMEELRLVTAGLVSKFVISFPAGDNGERVLRDMKDELAAAPGQLELVFERRS